jgi:hypothetical protein
MRTLGKSMILSVAALMEVTIAAKATEPAGVVLPDVSVLVPYSPYTSGRGQHISSHNFVKVVRVPKPTPATWYFDPYTSGASVCPGRADLARQSRSVLADEPVCQATDPRYLRAAKD